MKLQYLFDDIIIFNDIEGSSEQSEKCVKICENFAVDFGAWILRNFNNYGPNDEKELLEIFKKEKGL